MIAFIELNPARINDGEFMIEPFRIHIDTVTRHARHIIYNRNTLFSNLIEQGGLTDIGTSNHSNNRFTHVVYFFLKPAVFTADFLQQVSYIRHCSAMYTPRLHVHDDSCPTA